MTWLSSFFVGVLTGIAGLCISALCASLAIDWYRISSFEGGSGYFAVFLALIGGIVAFIIGMIVARTAGAVPTPSFLRSLGTALAVVVTLNGAIAGVARLLADVPPEIDGEQLLLTFEVKWPASETTDPRTLTAVPHASLGVTSGGTVRKQEEGAFLVEDARQEERRWIAPGAVRLFTSRGKPLLLLASGDKSLGGFLLPLASHPTTKDREWSVWMPHPRDGKPALPDGFRVRYRVMKMSDPFRTQRVGPFSVQTVARYFYYSGAGAGTSVTSVFRIAFNGKAIEGMQEAAGVDVVAGTKPALLVNGGRTPQGEFSCKLLVAEGDSVTQLNAGSCQSSFDARLLTNDSKQLAERRVKSVVKGWLDFDALSTPGLYRLDASILDTRHLTVTPFSFPPDTYPPEPPGIFAISPDAHSVVWYQPEPAGLGVTNYVTKSSYVVPIDRERMRYGSHEHLDPAWVEHHFTWVRVGNGSDSLVARTSFALLPYRGDMTIGRPGEYQNWTVSPGGEAIRDLVLQTLVSGLKGELLPQSPSTVTRTVRIDGKSADVFQNDSEYISVSLSDKDGDPALIRRIAAVLDAELATGKHDALFVRPKTPAQ
ncbi:MAG: hypothetical protein ABIT38_19755 [Gemmatimonadaceae bacterium]